MSAIPDLNINPDLARRILTGFIKSELNRMGFTRAVINLSGGIDSALSCYLAAEALGPENVLAIRLPYKSSSADSLEHAQMVIDALGVQANMVHIASEFICKVAPAHTGSLIGDKAWSAVFDNTKIKTFVPSYKAVIPFREGIRKTFAWFDADEKRRRVDQAVDKEMDEIIAAYTAIHP